MEKVAHEREQQHHVSTKLITVWATNMAAEKGLTAFVGSRGWLCNFLKRFNLTLRRRMTTGQSMPHDLKDKLYSFVDFNKKQRNLNKFQLSMIANMDQTPIWADMPTATTIDRRGVQAVPIRTTGHEKNLITVWLAVKADRTKITPYVVIPVKKVKKELANIPGVIVAATPNGWMNDNLTADWVEKVWTNFSFAKRMLVWDSFKCHISEDMKKQLQRYNTVMSVILGGCTKYLQPLDVCINKPFKQYFRELYNEWFSKKEFEYTSGGKIKTPSHLKQITWVVQAWGKVSKEVIINSFDVCGITTDNVAKIPCLRKEHGGADTEESTGIGNLGDIIDEDDNDNNEHES